MASTQNHVTESTDSTANTRSVDETESSGRELTEREERALYDPAMVLVDQFRAKDAPGLYEVVTTGDPYLVDMWGDDPVCECPDFQYRGAGREHKCKHILRVEFASGEREIPDTADTDRITPWLGCRFEAQP